MELGLQGRRAVVTGASKGIGLAIVRALVDEGVHVIAGARTSSPELETLAAAGSVEVVTVDLATADGPATLIAQAGDRLDILVNNVGLAAVRLAGFLEISDEQWSRSINLNLMAAVRATRAALPIMLTAGRGVIINTGSVNAFLPDPAVLDYSAAKAAVTNFAKSISKEFGPRGIRVNTVTPGPVETDLWLGDKGVAATVSRASGANPEDVARNAVASTATGRFSTPGEVADLVVLLASDRTANVTGSSVTIDGGLISTI
ncbi:short-subunit dehydrogenase [Jatrophihabitans sp. GAS493]|uniref:SDR family NAD(P)-dependent oxidoreductase n=1 Tax=Jatrophihabitans sp. GAS493 TaxID=1907575 RepID=UPI000BB78649|nr:SDR family NAD(P)-dependent oxidoreductase [Jatrophihabitans sp. GAS493]SOD73647.1 short-subunit dehydrogenase [Jatrophihabitans sp. GAS493]